jgi:rhamnose transport system substrate-binding protein
MATLTTPPIRPVENLAPTRECHAPVVQPQQLVLAGLLALEVAVFSLLGGNFFSLDNFFEIQRLGVELGLLALAMTPVIVTGGIDLSVGSLMALSAVLMGMMWRDAGVPIWLAAGIAVLVAALAGGLNALLITRLRIPPLIVTLGSYSLFRGLAEGITRGVVTYTKFPRSFVFLGNGYFGPVPAQVILLAVAAVAFWLLLHRTTIGRALSAIGYSPEGARHAGIPVERRVALAYVLSGLCAGLAAVVYVAHVDQAKANAGTGYELMAITAVVLGGTSIFGGRGSIAGTVMGLFAIVVLQNGLRMADRPVWLTSHLGGEMAGILTGMLLLLAIGLDWRLSRRQSKFPTPAHTSRPNEEEFEMKNSQLAVLSFVILVAALIVAGGNYMLVKSLPQSAAIAGGHQPTPAKQITIAMMPKSKGNAYFVACQTGAQEAAKELGVNLVWDGPTNTDPAEQNRIVDTWVNRGVDVIAVAVENREGLSTALRKARENGIKVVTWDADAEPDARDFFVNQATSEGIGQTLVDNAAKAMGGKGDFAIITASLTASNMNEWRKQIEKRLAEKYPDMKLLDVRPCDDQKDKAFDEANTLLNSRPTMRLIMAICSPAVPGAAEAVKQSTRKDVKVMGLGLPNDNKKYVHEGITDNVVLWNTMDLGYLTVTASYELKLGTLKPGDKSLMAGRLGKITLEGDNIVLGKPFTFTKENIDKFDF